MSSPFWITHKSLVGLDILTCLFTELLFPFKPEVNQYLWCSRKTNKTILLTTIHSTKPVPCFSDFRSTGHRISPVSMVPKLNPLIVTLTFPFYISSQFSNKLLYTSYHPLPLDSHCGPKFWPKRPIMKRMVVLVLFLSFRILLEVPSMTSVVDKFGEKEKGNSNNYRFWSRRV